MVKNVGGAERIARAIVGLALLSLFVVLEGNARWFGLIGVVLLTTAAISWCPLSALFGINTCKVRR